jgi:hypothetical protein
MAAAGGLPNTLRAFVGDKNIYRSPQALGPAYEHPERVTDETIDFYLKPICGRRNARVISSASWPRSIRLIRSLSRRS